MMYMHYCKHCQHIFMLNGHKLICPKCTGPLAELQISYLDYVDLSPAQREAFKEACADEEKLHQLKASYRMYKYSKWYKSFIEASEVGTPYQISSFVSCDFLSTHPLQPRPAY